MTKEQAFNIGLPKWPQCVIYGNPITKEQALEIIRRTDSFFDGYFGNNHVFNDLAAKICKLPQMKNYEDKDRNIDWDAYSEACDMFHEKWQKIDTNYIFNDWISCCWVGGPHGWCHPDGTIAFQNNIGKWPDIEDVYQDLETIAKEFPFLELTCTLMNDEEFDATESLVSFKIKDGEVEVIDTIPIDELKYDRDREFVFNPGNENYFEITTIKKWADEVYGKEQ